MIHAGPSLMKNYVDDLTVTNEYWQTPTSVGSVEQKGRRGFEGSTALGAEPHLAV